jgi:hypothetical protein
LNETIYRHLASTVIAPVLVTPQPQQALETETVSIIAIGHV